MRIALATMLLLALTRDTYAWDTPMDSAIRFFEALPARGPAAMLRAVRPAPATLAERIRAVDMLPESGVVTPDHKEREKLTLLDSVLAYGDRAGTLEIMVIDVPQAVVALHQRAVVLVSRPALRLLSGRELQAMVAHEIGHDYFWREFERTVAEGDRRGRQELELKCDGIAVLTLVALRLDPGSLTNGLRKQTRFNEMLGADANAADYPPLQDRQRFITTVRNFALRQVGTPTR